MRSAEQSNTEPTRLVLLLFAMLAAFLVLGMFLWRVQVLKTTQYTHRLDRQSMRRIRLPGARGSVYDRNGEKLAGNRPSYCIAIYVEELRQPGRWKNTIDEVERTVDKLSVLLDLERRITRDQISDHITRRLPLPLLAWRDVDNRAVAVWAENPTPIPSVDIYVEPVRVYPGGSRAAHVLGYVGRAEPHWDDGLSYHYYLPEMEGKCGIEKYCNADLTGIPGGRLIRVDASGFRYEERFERQPSPGDDVRLTIDTRLQQLAERSLSGVRGACTIMDPRNGDVLAMASAPAFDLGAFTPSISTETWRRFSKDPNKPLFNRATMGTYAPGSIFKPVVAIASLENKRTTPGTVYDCQGQFMLGNAGFHCWRKSGHGEIALRKAIEQSCNSYFCQLGLECGHERIYHMASALGFGRKSGVEIGAESSGLLPDNAWKMRVVGDRWRSGDTCNIAIGQGALSVTPLQMAIFASTLANSGTVYSPRLVLGRGEQGSWRKGLFPGVAVNRMEWSAATLEAVRGGMYDVINSETGTGKRARIPGIFMAGKTGTAEYGRKGSGRKYGWMIVFAPFDNPMYAVSMVVEDAVSGGITVAPRIREMMAGIFGVPDPAASEHAEVEG